MGHGPARKVLPPRASRFSGCTIGSIFPDIDIFAGPLARNPLAIMEWHRNITHSLVMLPVWAALLAAVSLPLARWLRWKAPSFPRLFVIYAVGLATHVFLDVVTNFGTMVWSPLKYSRVAWDWVFIIDLTLTAIALVPQLAAWCYREPRKFRGRAAAVWAALTTGRLRRIRAGSDGRVRISNLGCGHSERSNRLGAFRAGDPGRRFQVEQGKLVPRGPGACVRLFGACVRHAPEGAGRRRCFCGRASPALGKSRRDSVAADAHALGRIDQHARRCLADHVS